MLRENWRRKGNLFPSFWSRPRQAENRSQLHQIRKRKFERESTKYRGRTKRQEGNKEEKHSTTLKLIPG